MNRTIRMLPCIALLLTLTACVQVGVRLPYLNEQPPEEAATQLKRLADEQGVSHGMPRTPRGDETVERVQDGGRTEYHYRRANRWCGISALVPLYLPVCHDRDVFVVEQGRLVRAYRWDVTSAAVSCSPLYLILISPCWPVDGWAMLFDDGSW